MCGFEIVRQCALCSAPVTADEPGNQGANSQSYASHKNMPLSEPWSKKHKHLTRASSGGLRFSLSNSFAQPLSQQELMALTEARGDHELIAAYTNHSLEYTSNGGSVDLREAVADLYGPKITADNVIIFAGAQVALPTAAHALTNNHTHTIVFDPAYQSVQEAPVHAGSQVTRISLKASNGWQICPKEVEAAIRDNTRFMVINEPYNPAGTLMSRELQLQLVAIARQHGIYVLCDEVYRLLEHDPADRLPAMADLYERGLSCVTMSKPWGACGVTIGWLAFHDQSLRQRLIDVQCTCLPPRIQRTLDIALTAIVRSAPQILGPRAQAARVRSRRSWCCGRATLSLRRT